MKTWSEVVKQALQMHVNKDKYAYFYGAKGCKLTLETMQALWESSPSYFKRYTEKQKEEIFRYSLGKIGYDCSGFIGKITGCNTYSGAIWSRCDYKTTPALCVGGSILWKPGHVGLDIGIGGFFIHMAVEGSSVEMGRISNGQVKWESAGRLTGYIDYTGAINI